MDLPIIKTDRLILRPVELRDATDIYEYMSQKDVCKYLFSYCETLDETKRHLKVEFLSYDKRGVPSPYAIVLKKEHKVIGTCNFHTIDEDCGEIGFVLNPAYQHHGYMSEAVSMLIELGFTVLDLRRIQAMHVSENSACEHFLKQIGFVYEGCLRAYYTRDNQPLDMKIYSILKNEWRKKDE